MVEKLRAVQTYLRRDPAQVALTKLPRNEAKIYKETDFLSAEGHLLTFLILASSLNVVLFTQVIARTTWPFIATSVPVFFFHKIAMTRVGPNPLLVLRRSILRAIEITSYLQLYQFS